MNIGRFGSQSRYSMIAALVLLSVWSSRVVAQDSHSHAISPQHNQQVPDQVSGTSALIKIVQDSTERFKDVSVAEAEGYALQFGCVSGPDAGAMGLHYINGALVSLGVLDATRPQIVIYE